MKKILILGFCLLFSLHAYAGMYPTIPGLDRGVTIRVPYGVSKDDVQAIIISPDTAVSCDSRGFVTIDVGGPVGPAGAAGADGIDSTPSSDITFIVDGGGSVFSRGKKAWVRIPSNFTLTGWQMTVTPDIATVTADLYVVSYDYYPPTSNNSICLNTRYRPFIWKSNKNRDTNITTSEWRFHTLSEDMFIKCNIVSSDGRALQTNLTIYGTR